MKYDFYDHVAMGDHDDSEPQTAEEAIALHREPYDQAYVNRMQRDFLGKLVVFMIGIALGVIANLGAYHYLSMEKPPVPVSELDRPQAISVAIREAWGIEETTLGSKPRSGLFPLYLGVAMSDKEKQALKDSLPEFNFVIISSWDELTQLLNSYDGNAQNVITTVVGDVRLSSASGQVSVGLRSGRDMYASITYELKRENLLWRVSSSIGDLKLL